MTHSFSPFSYFYITISSFKKQANKQENKKQVNSNKLVYLLIVIVAFTIAFIILINRQNKDTYYLNTTDNSFNIKSKYGETIVARDGDAIYPKYYVAYINDNHYSIYVYNYYDTASQYELEFNRLLDQIVDYNADERMIRYLDSDGYATYNEVRSNLAILTGCDNLEIY